MTHEIYWRDDTTGTLYAIVKDFARLEYIRVENKVGWLTLDMPAELVHPVLLRKNIRLEPWRRTQSISPYLDGESAFFLQTWGWDVDSQGKEWVHLKAYDGNFFLDKRNIAYYSGEALATITTTAIDDAMKSIVRSNLGATATDTLRTLATWLTVQGNLTAAPTTTKDFSRRQVLTTLQDLANESYQQGTYLAFDTVYTGPATMEFRTYTGRRGVDHGRDSAQPVIINRLRGNLETPSYIEDHADEANYIYAGGRGYGTAQIVKKASNYDAVGLNRREQWIDARNVGEGMTTAQQEAAIQSEANAALFTYRAKKTMTGQLVDTETGQLVDTDGCQYGLHYKFGDIVFAEYKQGFDAHISAIHVTVEGGKETLDIQVRGEA